MITCPKCGKEYNESCAYCVSCGTNLLEIPQTIEHSTEDNSAKKTMNDNIMKIVKKQWYDTIGVVFGIVTIVYGLFLNYNAGSRITPGTYGGDIYTEIAHSLATIHQSIVYCGVLFEKAFSFLLISVGVFISLYFIKNIMKSKEEQEKSNG